MLFVMLRFVLLACVLGVSTSVTAQEPESPTEVEAEAEATATPPEAEAVDEAEVAVDEAVEAEVEVPPDPDAVEARMRFELGSNFYTQGRFAEALIEFRRSFELSGEPRLLHNMYLCERDAGHTTEAAGYLRRYVDSTGSDIENRQLLVSRLQTLEERVAREEEVRRQRREAVPEPPNRTLPIILFAVGGATLAAAGGLALHVNGLHSDLQEACYGIRCPETLNEDREALRRRAIAVDALWAAGLAISVTGIVAWVLSTPEERPIVVSCGLSRCSVEGRF